MRVIHGIPLIALLLVPAIVRADDDWEAQQEAERARSELANLANDLPVVTPEPGRDKAADRAPPWCDGLAIRDWSPSSLPRTLRSATEDWRAYLSAAEATCAWPKERSVQKAVGVIVQSWINITGLSENDAIASLKARLGGEKLEADHKQLCQALTISDEVDGEDKAFARARQVLFGCAGSDQALWLDTGNHVPDDLITYLDNSATPPDELVRLAWVTDRARFSLTRQGHDLEVGLLTYIYDQIDYQALSAGAIGKLMEQAPYKGSTYARVVVMESMGRARKAIAAVEALVKQKSADADWKELLVTAPQRGVAGWNAASATWKAQIARSNELEHAFWGPSRKAVKGCWKTLRGDFLQVAATLDHTSGANFERSLSDPVASLLFARLALCASIDHPDKHYAGKLVAISDELRYSRGPRLAAYYAGIDALNAILADRGKFPVSARDIDYPRDRPLYDVALTEANKDLTGIGYALENEDGIVKSVKKSGDGVVISFVSNIVQKMTYACRETTKLRMIKADGTLVYDSICHEAGMKPFDRTHADIVIPAEYAAGIKAGAALEFSTGGGDAPRPAMPTAVYADKTKKKLVNYYGLEL
jgi:hypothetical protein